MAAMPNFEADIKREFPQLARGVEQRMRELMHPRHHDGAPQPAATAEPHNENRTAPREETRMSLAQFVADAEAHAKAVVDKFAEVDHEALSTLDTVLANPETAEVFRLLGQFTGLPAGSISTAANVLRMTLMAMGGQQPASIAGDGQPQPA